MKTNDLIYVFDVSITTITQWLFFFPMEPYERFVQLPNLKFIIK